MQAEVKRCVDQEQHSKANQNHGRNRHLGFGLLAARGGNRASYAEHLLQAEGIWTRLTRLNRTRGANRVDNLVHPEEAEENSQRHLHEPWQICRKADNAQNNNPKVSQTLGVLTAIDSPKADWHRT